MLIIFGDFHNNNCITFQYVIPPTYKKKNLSIHKVEVCKLVGARLQVTKKYQTTKQKTKSLSAYIFISRLS